MTNYLDSASISTMVAAVIDKGTSAVSADVRKMQLDIAMSIKDAAAKHVAPAGSNEGALYELKQRVATHGAIDGTATACKPAVLLEVAKAAHLGIVSGTAPKTGLPDPISDVYEAFLAARRARAVGVMEDYKIKTVKKDKSYLRVVAALGEMVSPFDGLAAMQRIYDLACLHAALKGNVYEAVVRVARMQRDAKAAFDDAKINACLGGDDSEDDAGGDKYDKYRAAEKALEALHVANTGTASKDGKPGKPAIASPTLTRMIEDALEHVRILKAADKAADNAARKAEKDEEARIIASVQPPPASAEGKSEVQVQDEMKAAKKAAFAAKMAQARADKRAQEGKEQASPPPATTPADNPALPASDDGKAPSVETTGDDATADRAKALAAAMGSDD